MTAEALSFGRNSWRYEASLDRHAQKLGLFYVAGENKVISTGLTNHHFVSWLVDLLIVLDG